MQSLISLVRRTIENELFCAFGGPIRNQLYLLLYNGISVTQRLSKVDSSVKKDRNEIKSSSLDTIGLVQN